MLNLSTEFSPELKHILSTLQSKETIYFPGALDLIMQSYKSSFKQNYFRKAGLLMDKELLINSMDFNFMSILSHALWNGTRLSAELVLAYVDHHKCMASNYDLIM